MKAKTKPPSPFLTQGSQIVWSCPWFHVRQDEIILPDGSEGVFNIVQHPGAAWIIPVTADGKIVLLYHYRYTVDDWCWEVPAGGLMSGRTLEETAIEELEQEVGGKAADVSYVGRFYTANGICDEEAHIFLATGVTLGETYHEPAEVMEIHQLEISEVVSMARSGEISDGPTALAILLAEEQLLALSR